MNSIADFIAAAVDFVNSGTQYYDFNNVLVDTVEGFENGDYDVQTYIRDLIGAVDDAVNNDPETADYAPDPDNYDLNLSNANITFIYRLITAFAVCDNINKIIRVFKNAQGDGSQLVRFVNQIETQDPDAFDDELQTIESVQDVDGMNDMY